MIQLCLTCSIHPVHCKAVLIYCLFTLSWRKKPREILKDQKIDMLPFPQSKIKVLSVRQYYGLNVYSSNSCVRARTAKVLCFEKGSDFLARHGLQPTRLLCPWDFSGKNIGVACCSILQVISGTRDRTQVSHLWADSLLSKPPEKPVKVK